MKLVRATRSEYQLFIRPGIIDPWYHVPKERCKTRTQFEQWIDHLNDKTWFTPDHLTQFEAVWRPSTNLLTPR